MAPSFDPARSWRVRLGLGAITLALLGLLTACGGEPRARPTGVGPATAMTPSASAAVTAPTAAPIALKLLKSNPERGPVGTAFTLIGEGLPPGKAVQFDWTTWEGSYLTKSVAETIEFYDRTFVEKRVPLGSADADAQGRVSASLAAPEDFGEVHDIYAVVDGQDVARGAFRILRTATISPSEGPVGTLITVTVTGIGWKAYENTMSLRYDNKYTGFISAVTTKGTAVAQIRAAGAKGQHSIQLNGASPGTPYLNIQQSPVAHVPMDFRLPFNITDDRGPPAAALSWPDDRRVVVAADTLKTTSIGVAAPPGVRTVLEPASGPIHSQTTLRASGLLVDTEVQLFWVTARGNRVSPSGWSLFDTPLLKATTDHAGSLSASMQIPDDLGGWHVVKVVAGEKTLAEVPYFVERSLASLTPVRAKAGEMVTLQVKGVGWTELDNGVTATYDNAYIGYACGFNSNGDVTISLEATGGPGTHLIDLYPMIYQGHGKPLWSYQIPQLTFAQDFPGLPLGYRLPAFRLAIEVIE